MFTWTSAWSAEVISLYRMGKKDLSVSHRLISYFTSQIILFKSAGRRRPVSQINEELEHLPWEGKYHHH